MVKYIPLTIEQLIPEESWDDRYHIYRPAVPLQIFHSEIEPDEELENCSIGISVKYDLQQMLPVINHYLEWLTSCETEMVTYFQERLGEEVPEGWFDQIEIYNVSFIFDGFDDYGVTIVFGESIFCDHTIELDFEKRAIAGDRLCG